MQKASYLRPKKKKEEKKKNFVRPTEHARLPSLPAPAPPVPPGFHSPRSPGAELFAPRLTPDPPALALRVLRCPRREEVAAGDLHTSGVRLVPSLLPNPCIKNPREEEEGEDRDLWGWPEGCWPSENQLTPTLGREGGGGTGAFAKILNGRGFSVSRESQDLFSW